MNRIMPFVMFVIFYILIALAVSSCTDARKARATAYGSPFKVEMINCDGSVSKSWTSTGKPLSESNSDGYFFLDDKGNYVEVTGRLIFTKLPE